MARLGFTAVAALVVGVTFALWIAPEEAGTPEETLAQEPAAEPPAVAAASEVRATPTVASKPTSPVPAPPSVVPVLPSDPAPADPIVSSPPTPAVGVPTLPEDTQEVVEVPGFEPEFGEGLPDPEAVESGEAPPTPVDVEKSGDLIRRMLALYRQMGE